MLFCNYWPGESRYISKSSLKPVSPVVLVGAGASAAAGCPLVRGFFDKARDLLRAGPLNSNEEETLRSALGIRAYYEENLLKTEEDIDNIEVLMSLVDLEDLVNVKPSIEFETWASQLRRFVQLAISRSTLLPAPGSSRWVEADGTLDQYKTLMIYLATQFGRPVVISLNYDCVIEYVCHCLGIPFTYDPLSDSGVLILKLHGSLNWGQCMNSACRLRGEVHYAPIRHFELRAPYSVGYVSPKSLGDCEECLSPRQPLIVPPSWSKNYDAIELRKCWAAAASRLQGADSLITVGYSLPDADAAVRLLLHAGLSRSEVWEIICITGSDSQAAERWQRMFRSNWSSNHQTVRQCTLKEAVNPIILPALGGTGDPSPQAKIPPIPITATQMAEREEVGNRLRSENGWGVSDDVWKRVDWIKVLADLRAGRQSAYGEQVRSVGLVWEPAEEALPVEGLRPPT